jgi:hypothetical protein
VALRAIFLEKIVYPSLKRAGRQNLLQSGGRTSLKELQQLKVSAPEYAAKMAVMEENVKYHIQEEESQMFKLISQLPDDTLGEMAEQ